jgi:hypothetical protein
MLGSLPGRKGNQRKEHAMEIKADDDSHMTLEPARDVEAAFEVQTRGG